MNASSRLTLGALALLPALACAQSAAPATTPPADDPPPAPRQARPDPKPAPAPASKPSSAAKDGANERTERLDRVELQGSASDDTLRRASTAAKIVIGREEIERFGDSSIGEVLKRLPGVTTGGRPGRGGEIRMRGMGGGYTQILVNGERMPPGFSLDQLPPEQIERIEIMRAPTAEYGARAVAGTINVVLREALQRRLNELRAGFQLERGRLSPGFSWTRNDKLDDQGGAYNLTVNAMQGKRYDDVHNETLTRALDRGTERLLVNRGQSEDDRRSLNLTARLQWRLGQGSTLALQPFVVVNRGNTDSAFNQTQTPRALPGDPDYYNFDQVQTEGHNRFTMMRLNGQWSQRLDEASRLELRAGVGRARSNGDTDRLESLAGTVKREQLDHTESRNRSWSLNGKYSHQFENEHSLVMGLEGEGMSSDQTRTCLQNGLSCAYLLDFGDDLDAATQRVAVYAQDEWSMGPQWSFYAGLRWEQIRTESKAKNYAVSNSAGVTTPLLHAVYKLDEKRRDQIRMSLTRSYKSPNLQDLIARPSINSQYPCLPSQPCGPNEINYPDRMGNPLLKPELATGVDIAYEKYLAKGGILSANFFVRRIQDLIRNQPELEDVSWAPVQRWVSRPRNIGNARTMGVELEAKFRLDEYVDEAWPVNIRSNLSLFRSRVDGIQGPNNKLDQQPDYTLNLGADYKLRSLPLSVGASLNYTPANTIQQTVLSEASSTHKRVLDAFVAWQVNRDTLLRLSASNLAPLDYNTGSITYAPTLLNPTREIISQNLGRSFTVWQLRLEMKI